ncbi:MAG TPA: biotin--[acetyl-CoA-carboxylase] ligase [Pseudogracilibacillus sp.]|nr:biotin--[acetyl-CoA-carboxylase] ligase [Pseudogracilibacillus sp.]
MSSTRNEIIKILSSNNDQYISGQQISNSLHISRSAVWKHMNELKKDGYEIESKPRLGYRIIRKPEKLSANTLSWGLKTHTIGKKFIHYESIPSTQKLAHELAIDGAKHGTIIVADEQTEGRGRLGRKWESLKGDTISMSFILRPHILPYVAPQLTLLTATVIAEVIEKVSHLQPKIKWPNDILINDKKICGILTEMHAEQDQVVYVVIGIGMNMNQNDEQLFKNEHYQATSLKNETSESWDIKHFIQHIVEHFEVAYEQFMEIGFSNIKNKWEHYGFKMNEIVHYTVGKEERRGRFLGIAEDGALLMKQASGQVEKIYSAEISWF